MAPTFSDASALISGTSRVGRVFATYEQLCQALGEPHSLRGRDWGLPNYSCQWAIRTREGILTVYDHANYGTTITGHTVWWEVGGRATDGTDQPLHPVVALLAELTGCPVEDARPWCYRPGRGQEVE